MCLKETGYLETQENQKLACTLEFLGHIIAPDGIRLDPDKVAAVLKMSAPTSKVKVQRFLGMINFYDKGIPNRAVFEERQFLFGIISRKKAFEGVKRIISFAPVLVLFDPLKETIVPADSGSHKIGGALLQRQNNGEIHPIAYVSRTLSETKR